MIDSEKSMTGIEPSTMHYSALTPPTITDGFRIDEEKRVILFNWRWQNGKHSYILHTDMELVLVVV